MSAEIEKVILAGGSGQGILFAGKLLARAGMLGGLEVSWVPDTGPAGAAMAVVCTVIVSRQEIGSPLVSVPDAVIAFTPAARERLYPTVKPGGVLIEDAGGEASPGRGRAPATRDDVRRISIPFQAQAEEAEASRAANLVALGGLAAASSMLDLEALEQGLRATLGPEHPDLEADLRALRQGERYVQERRYMKERFALSLFNR